LHFLEASHGLQVPPPQSTSVSAPFIAASLQVGAWHVPSALQILLSQSVGFVQLFGGKALSGVAAPPPSSTPAVASGWPLVSPGMEAVLQPIASQAVRRRTRERLLCGEVGRETSFIG
jgi:hypothetical protein